MAIWQQGMIVVPAVWEVLPKPNKELHFEYEEELRKALIKHLTTTKFKDVGTTSYFETVAELLTFNDDEIKAIVIKKLKKDRHWENAKEKFNLLAPNHSHSLRPCG